MHNQGAVQGKNTARFVDVSSEVWERVLTLTGHGKNVTDVAWSHDDKYIASASLDTNVIIWDVASSSSSLAGVKLRVLSGHTSFVKGVAWDPIGRYVSTQSDDKSLVLWSTDTWQPVHFMRKSFSKTMGNNYSLRMGWSPDGSTLIAANAYSKPKHTAACFDRMQWQNASAADGRSNGAGAANGTSRNAGDAAGEVSPSFHLVGHKAPVVCAAFSPKTFKLDSRLLNPGELDSANPATTNAQSEGEAAAAAAAAGTASGEAKDANTTNGNGAAPSTTGRQTCHVVALCGQDQRISVWLTGLPRPILTIKKPFSNAMVDMCWTGDGRELIVASLDGTVCRIGFDKDELGSILDDASVSRILRDLYGDGAHGERGNLIPVSTDLMRILQESNANGLSATATTAATATAVPRRIAPQPVAAPASAGGAANDGTTEREHMNGSHERITPTPVSDVATVPPPATLPQQRETLQSDGRRRIMPVQINDPNTSNGIGGGGGAMSADAKRRRLMHASNGAAPASNALTEIERRVVLVGNNAGMGPSELVPSAPLLDRVSVQAPHVGDDDSMELTIEACNGLPSASRLSSMPSTGRHHPLNLNSSSASFITATSSSSSVAPNVTWRDRLHSPVLLLYTTPWFAAAATLNGELALWNLGSGRRLCPVLKVCSGKPAMVSGDGRWKILVVGSDGSIAVLDVQRMTRVLTTTLAPLLVDAVREAAQGANGDVSAPSMENAVAAVRLSRAGLPIAIMGDGKAYAWHTRLEAWSCIADTAFMASDFASSIAPLVEDDEVQALQPLGMPVASSLLNLPRSIQRCDTSRHLESLLYSSALLHSWNEFERWLRLYACHVSKCDDVDLMREFGFSLIASEDVRETILGFAVSERDADARDAPAAAMDDDDTSLADLTGQESRWKGVHVVKKFVLPEMLRFRSMHGLADEFSDIINNSDDTLT